MAIAALKTDSTPSRPAASPRTRAEKSGALVRLFYVLFLLTMLLEPQYWNEDYPDDIGRYVPFFQDISSWTHVKGLSASIAEVFMLLLLVATLFMVASKRAVRFDKGTLMRPIGLYVLMVAVAELYGIATGGNVTTSLWEVRGQVYILAVYILACNLIKRREQITTLAWLLVIGTGLRGIQGVWRYRITLGGDIKGIEAIFSHEQSYFFNAFILLTAVLFLYAGPKRLKRVALFLLPFVMIAALANQRRAAVLGIMVGLLLLLAMTALVYPARRRRVVIILVTLAILWEPYYAAFKNSSGLTGEIAHAVASSNNPSSRDYYSNLYRINEDKDIMSTMKSSTVSQIIGYGYGKPMNVPYPLANISGAYVFWNIMPHDSVLWVWMRTGTVGYVLLWIMIGLAIIQAAALAQRLSDPYLKGLAAWIALMIVQQMIFAYLDLQMTNYRNLITLGVLFALISRLATFARAEEEGAAPPDDPGAHDTQPLQHTAVPADLAVVNGRLGRRLGRRGAPAAVG